MPSPFPCSPVIRECSWRKTQIEKKNKKKEYNADQTDIFFSDIKTQFIEIFGENIGDYFEKY